MDGIPGGEGPEHDARHEHPDGPRQSNPTEGGSADLGRDEDDREVEEKLLPCHRPGGIVPPGHKGGPKDANGRGRNAYAPSPARAVRWPRVDGMSPSSSSRASSWARRSPGASSLSTLSIRCSSPSPGWRWAPPSGCWSSPRCAAS